MFTLASGPIKCNVPDKEKRRSPFGERLFLFRGVEETYGFFAAACVVALFFL